MDNTQTPYKDDYLSPGDSVHSIHSDPFSLDLNSMLTDSITDSDYSLNTDFSSLDPSPHIQPFDHSHPSSENFNNSDFNHYPDPSTGQPHYNFNPLDTHHSDTGAIFNVDQSYPNYHPNHTSELNYLNCTDDCPYTTINQNGQVYKHIGNDSDYVGYVDHRSVYSWNRDYLGYGGTDGKIYDHDDHCVGWVDSCGHVYNKAGVEVSETSKGVVGGAAYLLLVYYGGVT